MLVVLSFLCPFALQVYHNVDLTNTAEGVDVTFYVSKFIGELVLVPRREHAPVRLIFPMRQMASSETEAGVTLCNVQQQMLYIGIHGGGLDAPSELCAAYAIGVQVEPHRHSCMEHSGSKCDAVLGLPANASTGAQHSATCGDGALSEGVGGTFRELEDHVADFQTCRPYAWHDFKFTVPADRKSISNMVFRLTDLSEYNNPEVSERRHPPLPFPRTH